MYQKLAKFRKTGKKFHVFSSACAIKAYSAVFIKNGLPTFEKVAPTQPCQVKLRCQITVFLARDPQMETPVKKTKS